MNSEQQESRCLTTMGRYGSEELALAAAYGLAIGVLMLTGAFAFMLVITSLLFTRGDVRQRLRKKEDASDDEEEALSKLSGKWYPQFSRRFLCCGVVVPFTLAALIVWQTHEDVYNNVLDYSPSAAERLPWEMSCEEVSALPLQQLVGRGFWSEVYLTHKDGIQLAVKRFSPIEGRRQDLLDSWLASHTPIKEAAILRLFHGNPYVVQMYGECEGRLVLEYLPTTLHQEIILKHRQWRMGDILHLALKVAEAVKALHENTENMIIHADIRPDQFFMTVNGTVKIGDLNRAELVKNGRGACKLKARGKWRSPEEYRFDEMTQKSDVYSTGLVIWSILTGLTPLKEVPVEKVPSAVAFEGLRPKIPTNTPKLFSNLMKDCWKTDPWVRPSSAEVVRRIKRIIAEVVIEDNVKMPAMTPP